MPNTSQSMTSGPKAIDFYQVAAEKGVPVVQMELPEVRSIAVAVGSSGVVGLHFYGLHPQIASVTMFEMQEELSQMSERSVRLNALTNFKAVCCKLQEIPKEYCEKFSVALCNPPYERGGFAKEDYKKAICRKEITLTLPELAAAASRVLKCGGRFALVHRADRLAEGGWAARGRRHQRSSAHGRISPQKNRYIPQRSPVSSRCRSYCRAA